MNNTNKKISLLLIIGVFMVLGILILADMYKKKQRLDDFSKYAPIPMDKPIESTLERDSGKENITTTTKSDGGIQFSPYRIVIENRADLAKLPLPDKALSSLEENLDRYFNYYLDNGTNYYAEFVADSYISNYNLPYFTIHVKELDMDVRCTWYASRNIYHFTSAFNPDGE